MCQPFYLTFCHCVHSLHQHAHTDCASPSFVLHQGVPKLEVHHLQFQLPNNTLNYLKSKVRILINKHPATIFDLFALCAYTKSFIFTGAMKCIIAIKHAKICYSPWIAMLFNTVFAMSANASQDNYCTNFHYMRTSSTEKPTTAE